MLVLVGKSGSGKTTVARILEEMYGVKRAVTCTTRPPREGEIDGKDYHFLSPQEFLKKERAGEIAEVSQTGPYRYGSLKDSYHDDNSVIVLDPSGLRHIQKDRVREGYRVLAIHLYADDALLQKRLSGRGEDPDAATKRLAEDSVRFDGIINLCDYQIVQNENAKAEDIASLLSAMLRAGGV